MGIRMKNFHIIITQITHYASPIIDTMSEIVNQSLQRIAKGTGIIFTGTIIGMLLSFVSRVIIVRYITQRVISIFNIFLNFKDKFNLGDKYGNKNNFDKGRRI